MKIVVSLSFALIVSIALSAVIACSDQGMGSPTPVGSESIAEKPVANVTLEDVPRKVKLTFTSHGVITSPIYCKGTLREVSELENTLEDGIVNVVQTKVDIKVIPDDQEFAKFMTGYREKYLGEIKRFSYNAKLKGSTNDKEVRVKDLNLPSTLLKKKEAWSGTVKYYDVEAPLKCVYEGEEVIQGRTCLIISYSYSHRYTHENGNRCVQVETGTMWIGKNDGLAWKETGKTSDTVGTAKMDSTFESVMEPME